MEKKFDLLSVPVSAIVYNAKINARGETKTDVGQLAETIKAEGLIQPLAVRPAGKKFEPVEGGRRFRAIEQLVKDKAKGWTKDTKIPVISRKLTDAEALEASLTTHLTRIDLVPADEALAFNELLKQGKKADEIAADLAVSPRFVDQRLAIGRLPATILKALKAGEIDTRTAEALTLTKDPKLQFKVFTDLGKRGNLNHQSVRQQLTGKATSANDAHARFVGEKHYVAAGGTVTADLFGEDRWFEDGKLLGKLFDLKVAETAKALETDGWSFVKIARDHWYDYDTGGYMGKGWSQLAPKGQPSPEAKKRVTDIDAELGRLKTRAAEIEKADPNGDNDVLQAEFWEIEDETIPALTEERAGIPTSAFTPEQKAKSGVVIRIDTTRLEIMYGMVDPATARAAEKEKAKTATKKQKAKKATAAVSSSVGGSVPAEAEEPDFSGTLKTDLAKYMGGALQMAIAGRPQAAHYALIAALVMDALKDHCESSPIAIGRQQQPYDYRNGYDEKPETTFDKLLAETLKPFIPAPPEDKAARKRWAKDGGDVLQLADLLAKIEQLDHDALMRLQAVLVARALNIDMGFMADIDMQTAIKRFDPEVGKYWTPDREFFGRLKKPDLIDGLAEAAVANIPRGGTKAQLVELATAELPAKGWLPKPLRSPCYAGPGSNGWADAQGAKVTDRKETTWQVKPGTSIHEEVPVRTCRKCGCSQNDACLKDGEACHWVEQDLCSHCTDAPPQQAAAE